MCLLGLRFGLGRRGVGVLLRRDGVGIGLLLVRLLEVVERPFRFAHVQGVENLKRRLSLETSGVGGRGGLFHLSLGKEVVLGVVSLAKEILGVFPAVVPEAICSSGLDERYALGVALLLLVSRGAVHLASDRMLEEVVVAAGFLVVKGRGESLGVGAESSMGFLFVCALRRVCCWLMVGDLLRRLCWRGVLHGRHRRERVGSFVGGHKGEEIGGTLGRGRGPLGILVVVPVHLGSDGPGKRHGAGVLGRARRGLGLWWRYCVVARAWLVVVIAGRGGGATGVIGPTMAGAVIWEPGIGAEALVVKVLGGVALGVVVVIVIVIGIDGSLGPRREEGL